MGAMTKRILFDGHYLTVANGTGYGTGVKISRNARTMLLASLVLCLSYIASAQQKAESEEAYGPLPSQKLVLCPPQTAGVRSPGVILLHGGGWVGGTAADLKGKCAFFAQHGFVAATVEYRLASETAHWPAQREDAQLALQWLRAHS